MIKFYNKIDINNSDLILSFNSAGLTGNFASTLLIHNNEFENIGYLFWHYLNSYASNTENGTISSFNGEIYINSHKRIALINFFAEMPVYFITKIIFLKN